MTGLELPVPQNGRPCQLDLAWREDGWDDAEACLLELSGIGLCLLVAQSPRQHAKPTGTTRTAREVNDWGLPIARRPTRAPTQLTSSMRPSYPADRPAA